MLVLLVVPVLSACLEAASLLAVGLMGLGYKCCVYLCSGVVPTAAPLGGINTNTNTKELGRRDTYWSNETLATLN